ncbi:MAG TPA: hypothetical protein VGC44_10930 [Longimicrobiales bacterium]
MNLTLTDQLQCPACRGPGGLVLLADRVEGRRVLAGTLGCANCRAKFRVADGVAEFATGGAARSHPDIGDKVRLAALLGVAEGPATLLLVGPYEGVARGLAAVVNDVEVIVATAMPQRPGEREGVSVLQTDARLPLRDGSVSGVMITGVDAAMIPEAVRAAGLATRVVLLGATPESADALRAQGVQVVVEQDDTLVAVRVY